MYDPAGAAAAGFLDQIVAPDDVVPTALAQAAELAERLNPKAFAATRSACRGELAVWVRDDLVADLATFTVDLPGT